MKPIPPMTIVPKKQIFIESHSSVLPGFVASFSNRDTDVKNDLSPKVPRSFQNYVLICKVIPQNNQFLTCIGAVFPVLTKAKRGITWHKRC